MQINAFPGRNKNNENSSFDAPDMGNGDCRVSVRRDSRLRRRQKIRFRRQRYRNQTGADRAAQRPGFALWRGGPGRRSLFPDAEREGRHQRPQDEVLALFGSLGTAPQTAVHKYLNSKGVPQLLLNTGASKWNDPKNNKWTMAGLPLYPTEARILAKYVLNAKPNAKIGILYQNDDFGRDFLAPFKQVLADAGGTA